MHSGNFILVLHTHLPWVLHHGTWPHGVDWLTEAVAECYIPLLNVFNELMEEGIYPKITMDISPILCEQLEHPALKEIFIKYCDEKISAAAEDEKHYSDWGYDAHHIYLTRYWQWWYGQRKNDFVHKYSGSIIGALKKLQDNGAIEILTCGATHGYLPLLPTDESVNLQVQLASANYKKHFGREARGIWLPECAYRPSYNWKSLIPIAPFHKEHLRPGIEQFLARYNLKYFITDEDLTKRANPLGAFLDAENERFLSVQSNKFKSTYASFDKSPLSLFNCSSSEKTEYGTAVAFTRHHDISMQVWSGQIGYPGESNYLDFHKKSNDSRLRYWRVTDNKADMMYKLLYHPDWTAEKIDMQSNHFIHHIENSSNFYRRTTGKFASVCTPFDTELFGHWWFEGPQFIKAVLKGLHNSPYVNAATAFEQYSTIKPKEVMLLPEGSWGENNNHDVWSNKDTNWTWVQLYDNENRLRAIYKKYPLNTLNADETRVLKQALRELLLLQSSDWQFLIYTFSARDYAEQRFSFHHSDFNTVLNKFEKLKETGSLSAQDWKYIEETEKRNCPFQELDLSWWKE